MRLGVNENPLVKTYAYSAYLGAILENRTLFSIDIPYSLEKNWKYQTAETEFRWENRNLSLIGGPTQNGKDDNESFAYTDYDEEHGLVCRINQICNLRNDAIVNLFIGCRRENEKIDTAIEKSFKVGYSRYGILINDGREEEMINAVDLRSYGGTWNKPIWLSVKHENNNVVVRISRDGNQFFVIYEKNFELSSENLIMGIHSEFLGVGDNYYNWLFTNYTEVILNKRELSQVYINYYNEPFTGLVNEQSAPGLFLDTCRDLLDEIVFIFNGLKEYLSFYLSYGYYTVVSIDEYYIREHSRFEKEHFYHPVLIYGYDEDSKEYLGLDYDMKLFKARIPESVMEMECVFQRDYPIMRYRYLPSIDIEEYHFSLASLKKQATSFLKSCPDEERYSYRGQRLVGLYGIEALNSLITDEETNNLLFKDRRMSYFLYEHSFLMGKRVSFMLENGYGDKTRLLKMQALTDDLIGISEAIKNNVIWIKMAQKAEGKEEGIEKRKSDVKKLLEHIIGDETELMKAIVEL